MKLVISIDCDNAAFEDDCGRACANVLLKLVARLSQEPAKPLDGDRIILRDDNGNTVGKAEFVDRVPSHGQTFEQGDSIRKLD